MSLQNTFLFKDVSTDSFRGNWDLRFWIDVCCPTYIRGKRNNVEEVQKED